MNAPAESELDWRLQAWMAFRAKRQADMVRDLGWSRRKASEVYNGDQQYKRDLVNELAAWLQLEPYELLLSPEEAIRLRQIREAAGVIAGLPHTAERGRPLKPQAPEDFQSR